MISPRWASAISRRTRSGKWRASTGSPVKGSIALIHGSPSGNTGSAHAPYALMPTTIAEGV